jgi:hypothetical protein
MHAVEEANRQANLAAAGVQFVGCTNQFHNKPRFPHQSE